MIKVAASILSADFLHLEKEIKAVEKAGADMIHLDIMDGHFVPNISFGPDIVSYVKKASSLPLDVHLMITNPEQYIDKFIQAGANYLSFHCETTNHQPSTTNYINRLVHKIKEKGVKAGIALNPATSLNVLDYILDDLDFVLIMSVNPGFGGQEYIEHSTEKINNLFINQQMNDIEIEVDGGINDKTGKLVRQTGANILVAGSYIFNSNNYAEAIWRLKNV